MWGRRRGVVVVVVVSPRWRKGCPPWNEEFTTIELRRIDLYPSFAIMHGDTESLIPDRLFVFLSCPFAVLQVWSLGKGSWPMACFSFLSTPA